MKFEFKKVVLFVFEKEKRKKENLTFSPFSPQKPTGPSLSLPQRPSSPPPFLFSLSR
jgi:hypothetical protein